MPSFPPSVETSTPAAALDSTVHFVMCVSSAQDNTLTALAQPYLWGSLLPTLDKWGACTPLQPLILEFELSNHPDKAFVKLLLSNIRLGCKIGYTGPQFAYTAKNLQSSLVHSSISDNALYSECMQNRILGPFNSPPVPNLRCSGLGVAPKHDGGWRTIYHLSAPLGLSINDFIDPVAYALNYCTVDDAFAIVNKLGPGTLLCRLIPVAQ